jgi:hypothetical protein
MIMALRYSNALGTSVLPELERLRFMHLAMLLTGRPEFAAHDKAAFDAAGKLFADEVLDHYQWKLAHLRTVSPEMTASVRKLGIAPEWAVSETMPDREVYLDEALEIFEIVFNAAARTPADAS